jgi:pimeloyl-ACP methyl ester carboxylesterase
LNVDLAVRPLLGAFGVRGRHLDTGLARHHVYEARGRGRLPPIVILPGFTDSAASYVPVIVALRRASRRVLVVESAGHGLSGQPRAPHTIDVHFDSITAALDALLDEPALIFGNSLGGATAVRYASTRPERVRGLFLTSPGGAPLAAAQMDELRATFTVASVAEARALLSRVAAPALARLMAPIALSRSRSRGVAELLHSLGPDDALSADEVGALAAPIRMIWGRGERLLPVEALAFWKAALPAHATIAEPDGIGHCPHLDAPLRLSRLIHAFATAIG